MLRSVEKAGMKGLRLKRNPVEISPQDFFSTPEILRKEYAKLINTENPNRIALIPSVSYGISTVANNIGIERDQNILVAADQFPSNYYPWERLCKEKGSALKIIAPENSQMNRGKKWNEKILEGIDSKTKIVALGHCHWADGTKFDLERIRKRTNEVGALMIIDGTQSVGALPFDVQKLQPDALICAGYKWLLGPYSLGLAYYGPFFDKGTPLEENWINRLNSEDFTSLVNYQPEYQPGALRYEVGEHSNFTHVPMLLNAISQLKRWHIENIQEYCGEISRNAIARLREKGFWIEDEDYRGKHLFGIRLPKNADVQKVKSLFEKNKIHVSFRGDAIRVSPNVYNDENDLLKLERVLVKSMK